MANDWEDHALPLLQAVYARRSSGDTEGTGVEDLASDLGVEDAASLEMHARDLAAAGYVELNESVSVSYGDGSVDDLPIPPSIRILPKGLRAVGAWPAET